MLEQLDKIDGVEASSANHTGTMVRITVRNSSDRQRIADAVQQRLAKSNRKPVRIKHDELKSAIDTERWRTKEQIGELTAIEFRKLALDRVKGFIRSEKVADETAPKLLKVAEARWDRLAQEAETKEPRQLPHKIDWKRRCGDFARDFTDGAKELLTAEQRQRFKESVQSCFSRLPDPVK